MAVDPKLGVRLNRLGCEDGRKTLENPFTSEKKPLQDIGRTLCVICVHLDMFHGPVSFFLGHLVLSSKSPSKRTSGKYIGHSGEDPRF